MKLLQDIAARTNRLLSQPGHELTRMQRSLRFTIELTRHCWRELWYDRATEMAAALTYRTIFSLVPVFVLALVVFNAFGGFKSVGDDFRRTLYDALGVTSLSVGPAVPETAEDPFEDWDPDDPAPAAGTQPATRTNGELRARLDQLLGDLTDKASGISFRGLGAVGLVLFIWAAVGLLVSIEDSFNVIYNCPRGRAWRLRIPVYWAVITLGPVLLFVSLYLSGQVFDTMRSISVVGPVVAVAGRFIGVTASWLLLFLLFLMMPNTKVNWRCAAIGALVTALLYELGKWGFRLYLDYAVGYSLLYGSLGLLPLFLFWLYCGWLIVLFGVELTYTLQTMRGGRFKSLVRREQSEGVDPQWLIPLMVHTARAFAAGQSVTPPQIAQKLGIPVRAAVELAGKAQQAGLLHRVNAGDDEGMTLALALPPQSISVSRLLELARTLVARPGGPAPDAASWAYLDQIARRQQEEVGQATLATLLETKP